MTKGPSIPRRPCMARYFAMSAASAPNRPTRLGFIRQVIRLAGAYWSSEDRLTIRGATLVLFGLTLAQVALVIWTNYWNRALFDALEIRSLSDFLIQIGNFVFIFGGRIVAGKLENNHNILNWIIGGIFLVTSIIQIWKMSKKKDTKHKMQKPEEVTHGL